MNMNAEHLMLYSKYYKKVKKVKERVINDNIDLSNDVEIIFYMDTNFLNKILYHDPNHKAYCIKEKKEIYLSDTVCEMDENSLYEIILHELLHIKYKNYSEEQIIEETNKRLPINALNLIKKALK